jgi:pimeloyl-ACP methyl ester carboxylesterase
VDARTEGGEFGESVQRAAGGGGSPVERVVGLDGAGHCPLDEVPDEVNGLILDFLDRLGR